MPLSSVLTHTDLDTADIGPDKHQQMIFTEQAAGNAVPILFAQLLLREIGTDDRRFFSCQPNIDHIINAGQRKLVDDLGTQIVDDEQIAVVIPCDIFAFIACDTVAETLILPSFAR